MSLDNRTICLRTLGYEEEATDVLGQVVDVYRTLAERFPEAYEKDLADALYRFANSLLKQEEAGKAQANAVESVAVYRRLVNRSSAEYEPALALSLCLLGSLVEVSSDIRRARDCFEEAVELFRRHQGRLPEQVDPYLPRAERELERLQKMLTEGE
jgi:tetratricopeptide (TPR) repeat protein